MQKIFLVCMLATIVFTSCQNSTSTEVKNTEKDSIVMEAILSPAKLIGSYVGAFGDNKISLLITKTTADSIEGRSIVGGFDRPFKGTIKELKGQYEVVVNEPGDDKHDGKFQFTFDNASPDQIAGSWMPYKETETIKGKNYSLTRKAFVYKNDVGDYPEGSTRLLKSKDVENMMRSDLEMMRNEIFARHGYCFKKKELRQSFENYDWYVPNTIDVKNDLTEIEKKNILLIKKYEKYAEDYGDDFGR